MQAPTHDIVQEDIDAAVLYALENKSLPSRASRAGGVVRQSVVCACAASRCAEDPKKPRGPTEEKEVGVGSGVVILENGTILTNLHVVRGMKRVMVTFSDGMESDAVFVAAQPENDLAVIRATNIPDDLPPATMGSTARLRPGDEVVAGGLSVRHRALGVGRRHLGPQPGLRIAREQAPHHRAQSNSTRRPTRATPAARVTMDGEVVAS